MLAGFGILTYCAYLTTLHEEFNALELILLMVMVGGFCYWLGKTRGKTEKEIEMNEKIKK
ncbi:MAG: hypothetical protein ABIJ91_00615 [Candidatus Kuenenbacteria bacterium]